MLAATRAGAGDMDNGGDFGGTRLEWDMKSSSPWDWDNIMLPGRKSHASSEWNDEAVVVSSGIPGIAATSSTVQASSCGVFGNSVEENVRSKADGKKAFLNLGAGAVSSDKVEVLKIEGTSAPPPSAAAQDAETGLKLGLKRTYENSSATTMTTAKGAGTAPTGTTAAATAGASPAPSPSKKPRGSSAAHTPRCQVEGCKTDLSSAKDYHRRHKVCAMHSKSAKVCVNSIEQRFCQQCSRFHVLTEFDEGKRSCRRRLAGHNERRRKPQPDPMALASAALPYTQADWMRRAAAALAFSRGGDFSYGFTPQLYLDDLHSKLNYSSKAPRLGSMDDAYGSRSGAGLSLMVFPRKNLSGLGHHQHYFMHGAGGGSTSMGQTLSLSSSAGTGLYAPGLGQPPPTGVTGITSESGRALSLLSSQPWAASNQDPLPLDMSHKLEQMIPQQQQQQTSSYSSSQGRHQQSYASSPAEKLLSQPQQAGQQQQQQQQQQQSQAQQQQVAYLSSMGVVVENGYDNHHHSVLTLSDLRGLHQQQSSRPTIDLMHINSNNNNNTTTTTTTTTPTTSNGSNKNNSNSSNNTSNNSSMSPIQQQQQHSSSSIAADFQMLKAAAAAAAAAAGHHHPPYATALYDPQAL